MIIYKDSSYDFIIKLPTTSYLLKKIINIEDQITTIVPLRRKFRKHFSSYHKKRNFFIYMLSQEQLFEIALFKSLEFIYVRNIEKMCKMIVGSALSMVFVSNNTI